MWQSIGGLCQDSEGDFLNHFLNHLQIISKYGISPSGSVKMNVTVWRASERANQRAYALANACRHDVPALWMPLRGHVRSRITPPPPLRNDYLVSRGVFLRFPLGWNSKFYWHLQKTIYAPFIQWYIATTLFSLLCMLSIVLLSLHFPLCKYMQTSTWLIKTLYHCDFTCKCVLYMSCGL